MKQKEHIKYIFKRTIAVSLIIANFISLLFCFVPLPIMLFFFGKFYIELDLATSIYSINWTIFGILVAIIGIAIPLYKHFKIEQSRELLIEVATIVIGLLLVCIQLALTPLAIFSGNNQAYFALAFSTLYFVSLIFLHVLIAVLIVSRLAMNKEHNKQ